MTAQTPMIKSRIRTAASASTWRRRDRRAGAAGGGGDGYATATVSGSNGTVSAGGGGGAPRSVRRRVDATGGAITIVLASTSAGGALSADSSASTNSVAEAHLEAGSLASPFISTASTSVPRDATRALGGVGRRWTCAYRSSINPSPSKGMTPVSISYAIVASEYRSAAGPTWCPVTCSGAMQA